MEGWQRRTVATTGKVDVDPCSVRSNNNKIKYVEIHVFSSKREYSLYVRNNYSIYYKPFATVKQRQTVSVGR